MDTAPDSLAVKRLSQPEFIGLIAMLFAMVAFSIDAMLPALPQIAQDLSPDAPNRAQLIVTSFVFGMGLGTLFTGPLSDRFGRKPVILCGAALYILGAAVAYQASTLNEMLAARAVQGLGVAGPRIVALAIIRDLYEGRRMAQIMSYAMMIFTLVPALAPLMGAVIINAYGWRMIFGAFIAFCLIASTWLALRQPETLPPDRRRPFRPATLWQATRECFSHRVFTLSASVQALSFGILFGMLSTIQPLFDDTYGRADSFPKWFGLIAVIGGTASVLNARLVVALGMRQMIQLGLGGLAALSAVVAVTGLAASVGFPLFMIWATAIFFMIGLVLGNLNALAMEPLGHIGGLAASVMGSVATVLGVVIAVPIGLAFDGTPVPLAIGITALSLVGFALIRLGLR